MVVQQHTINRQIIELVVAKQDDVQHLCQLAEDVFQAQVLPELDRYFSDVCSSETLVIIDHLEIDIGHISQGNFQNDFVENIFRAIHQSLPTLAMQTARDQIFRKPLEDPMPIGRRQSGVDAPTGKQRALSAHQSSFECLDCFLNTGTVPWWHIPSEKQSIEQWFRDASTSPAELRFMLKTHLADPIHRTRLIHQLSESLMFSVAELLQPNIAESIHQAATNLATLQAKTDWIQLSSDSFRFCVWTEVIEMLLDQERKEHNRGLCLLRILNALAVQSNTSCNELVLALQTKLEKEYKTQNLYDLYTTLEALHSEDATQRITGPADDTSLSTLQPSPQNYPIPANAGSWATTIESESNKPIIHDDEDSKTEQASQPQDNIASNEEPAKTECQDEAYGLLGTYHQFLNDLRPIMPGDDQTVMSRDMNQPLNSRKKLPPVTKSGKHPEIDLEFDHTEPLNRIYIQNAGLVLLWPCLRPCFEALGLCTGNSFVNDNAGTRAIHLLHYMGTGQLHPAEHLLPLNKLLCAWELARPVSRWIMLTDAEKEESDKLLGTLISNWSVLKNTSIEGLRTSFLQRPGILEKKTNWLLTVEHKAHDVLLEQLPWSISVITLSWMQPVLYVEW